MSSSFGAQRNTSNNFGAGCNSPPAVRARDLLFPGPMDRRELIRWNSGADSKSLDGRSWRTRRDPRPVVVAWRGCRRRPVRALCRDSPFATSSSGNRPPGGRVATKVVPWRPRTVNGAMPRIRMPRTPAGWPSPWIWPAVSTSAPGPTRRWARSWCAAERSSGAGPTGEPARPTPSPCRFPGQRLIANSVPMDPSLSSPRAAVTIAGRVRPPVCQFLRLPL